MLFLRDGFIKSVIVGSLRFFFVFVIELTRMGFAIAVCVLSFILKTYARFEHFGWAYGLVIGLSIVSDVCVTASLCWHLYRRKTGHEWTDSIIDRLLLYFVNAGLLTMLSNSACLVCAITMPKNLIFIGLYFATCELYANSFMAVVNSRRGMLRSNENGSFELRDVQRSPIVDKIQLSPKTLLERRRQSVVTTWRDGSRESTSTRNDSGGIEVVDLDSNSRDDKEKGELTASLH